MRIGLCVILALTLSSLVSPAHAAVPRPLEALSFLVGEWQGEGSGQPGTGGGACTFASGLQDRVIIRTSFAEYPSSTGKPAARHDDLMIIYAGDSGDIRADYYDSEGHIIRYVVTATAGREAVFLSEVAGEAPRFRLTYTLGTDGLMSGRFDVAPPGKPDSFSQYLAWTVKKVTSKS